MDLQRPSAIGQRNRRLRGAAEIARRLVDVREVDPGTTDRSSHVVQERFTPNLVHLQYISLVVDGNLGVLALFIGDASFARIPNDVVLPGGRVPHVSQAVPDRTAAVTLMHFNNLSIVVHADIGMEPGVVLCPFRQPLDVLVYRTCRVNFADLIKKFSVAAEPALGEHNDHVVIVGQRNTWPSGEGAVGNTRLVNHVDLAPSHLSSIQTPDVIPQGRAEEAFTLVYFHNHAGRIYSHSLLIAGVVLDRSTPAKGLCKRLGQACKRRAYRQGRC